MKGRGKTPEVQMVNANGVWRLSAQGYWISGTHPNIIAEHIMIAERALGKRLPEGALVHHMNGVKTDNDDNLAIFPSLAYHNLIHARMNALAACGDPNKRKCKRCGTYDCLSVLKTYPSGREGTSEYVHPECHRKHSVGQRLRKRRLLRCAP